MRNLFWVLIIFISTNLSAQMEVDGEILYGNEWIDYDKVYVKIKVDEDGIYNVSREDLIASGIPLDQISIENLVIYHFGKSMRFYADPNGNYIEFFGERNRSEIDKFIYMNEESILNPEYSVVSNESAYFVTWTEGTNPLLYTSIKTDLSSNNLQPEATYLHQQIDVQSSTQFKPTQDSEQVRYSNFVTGEGYGSGLSKKNTIDIPLSEVVNNGNKAFVNVRFCGNKNTHTTSISINGSTVETLSHNSYDVVEKELEISIDQLGNSNLNIELESSASNSDKNIIAFAQVRYPRAFKLNSDTTFLFHIAPSNTERYFEIEGYEISDLPIIYDLDGDTRIEPETLENNKIGFLLPPHTNEKRIYLASSQFGMKDVLSLEPRQFVDYDNPDYNYIMISSKDLRSQGNTDWVQEYADYRASELGGGYNPIVANVDQLYDQYAYGIDRHFIALRNFGFWTKENYTKPEFMFIVGKGLEYRENRTKDQVAANADAFIPTWGNPGSDNLILSNNTVPVSIYPVGRIAANSPEEIRDYLDKIKQHDQNALNPQTIDDRLWQKKVLHLSGGTTNIQENLFNSLAIMGDIVENNKYGADVVTFRKVSTEAISDATSDLIFEEINSGLSILTFFGHASVGAFDFNLDNVERYENKGKYPMILSLGCYSGNIHTTNDGGISESFVKAKDKGAVAFLAASGTAYIGVQNGFGKEFYSRLGDSHYGRPIGEAINEVKKYFENFNSYEYVTFFQQLTLHGDPAIRLPNFETPDYVPDNSTVKTDPKFIDTYEENFEVCFDVTNIGLAVLDSFTIQVVHQNPSGIVEYEIETKFATPSFRENYCFTIPIASRELVGQNKILVHVDHQDVILELPNPEAESNNYLRDNNNNEGFEFFILNNSAVPTFPEEFGIVTTEDITLIANTFNALGEEQTFFVEIDTTMNFDSPSLVKRTFENIRSVLKWNLDQTLINEMVYYWRVGSENKANGEIVWRESSFVYEPGQRNGWNQSHYFQFLKDEFSNLEYDSLRNLKFVDNVKEIVMDNGPLVEFRINSSLWGKWRRNINSGVAVILFDPILGESDRNWGGDPRYGSVNTNVPVGSWTHHFEFPTSTLEERQNLINVLRDSIPDGYVVALNFVEKPNADYNIEEWAADTMAIGTSIFKTLEGEGALRLDELRENGSVPYIFTYLKGNDKVLAEIVAAEDGEQIQALFQIKSLWDKGEITSTKVGPASSWDEMVWDSEIMDTDTVKIDIFGVRYDDTEELLFEDFTSNSIDISSVDSEEYPFLKLKYFTADPEKSASQIQQLRVYFEGMTDLTLNPDNHFVFYNSKIDEGDVMKIEMDISNITNIDANATSILFSIIDEENNQTDILQDVGAIKKGESERNSFEINTKGMKGTNTIEILLNPSLAPKEQYYFNNFGLAEFEIIPDSINPLLNVTFDGVQIMNEDIVSAQPFIRIELDDSNPYLLIDNPDNFLVTLTGPNEIATQLSLDDPSINFIPAESSSNNNAVIEYNPKLDDGRYLLSVQGKDVSGNNSGSLNYEVNFRVFNEEMVSNVFNYPNPFSTSTQFIFTLTGDEEPGNVLIRIMTLSGKVVREITTAELGNLRIGTNRTEMKWNGTDEFGNKLGNGTYLYQVITKKLDGSNYSHFSDPTQNNTDYLFKKGFGKLVIMR